MAFIDIHRASRVPYSTHRQPVRSRTIIHRDSSAGCFYFSLCLCLIRVVWVVLRYYAHVLSYTAVAAAVVVVLGERKERLVD